MKIPIYQIDAFTNRPLKGNPAAVCPLERWLPDALLQGIAAENNLPETAYFVKRDDNGFDLRWFTPVVEIGLCGHATLASAHVLFHKLGYTSEKIDFHTQSGLLSVTRQGDLLALDFPSRPAGPCGVHTDLLRGIGRVPKEVLAARDYLLVFQTEQEVRALKPDMGLLSNVDRFAVIATAPGDKVDFVSRFFAPAQGIPEDPVTGSAHCTLIPYWSKRLGKAKLHAWQVSPRGGELFCEDHGDRVSMAGYAAMFMEGQIELPDDMTL